MSETPQYKKWYDIPYILIPLVILGFTFLFSVTVYKSFFGCPLIFLILMVVVFIIGNKIKIIKPPRKIIVSPLDRMKEPERKLWDKLGSTPEEREKNIYKMFDEKNEIIYFGDRSQWMYAGFLNYIQFCLSRSLAAMEQREREFLRIVFLLYNRGFLSNDNWNYYGLAFINGDGKASINSWGFHVYDSEKRGIKDGPSMIKFFIDSQDASVNSAINNLLRKLDKIEKEMTDVINLNYIKKIKVGIHGDQTWFTEEELDGSIFNVKSNYNLNLGHLENSNAKLHYSGEGSLITIAPPGSGKTQCFVIPNMLSWKGAALILDIKGEIYEATHKWREKNVGRVLKFSPLSPNTSNNYNPLTFIRQDPDFIWEDSRFLADMMIVPSGAADPFWENMARDVVTASIAYVCFNNETDDRAMSKIIDIVYGIGWEEMITHLKTNVLIKSMQRMGHSLSNLESKTKDSILKTAQSSLSAWQGERISKVTQKSDWNPLDLRHGTPTIYICINPNEIDSYLSVIRVFIAQHIRMLTSELPQRDSAPVLFMLDELPRLKRMAPVDEALNIGRQYGLKLWLFAQSYGQIKEAYPDPEGLLGNCVIRTFMNLPLSDEFTTKISDQLGYRHDSFSNSKEKIAEPIELAGPNYKNTILVFATNTKPAKVSKQFAFEDKELQAKINGTETENL